MDEMDRATEAQKYVWGGAIPLQIHLHDSEVTTLEPPPPYMILAPRIGYLPLLVNQIKPLFKSALPPGADTAWFEYKGLPLKWYLPIGVLFDLLCAEPERPWNIMVHFSGYPRNVLTPCDGEDAVKWNFINSIKEAAYIINGNCKNIMNMSQLDQTELWQSVLNGNLESFMRVASKLKLGAVEDEFTAKLYPSLRSQPRITKADSSIAAKTGRIPVRLYVWNVDEDFVDLEDAPSIDSWERVSYINRPIEVHRVESKCFNINDALKALLPEYFGEQKLEDEKRAGAEEVEEGNSTDDAVVVSDGDCETMRPTDGAEKVVVKLLRIQGIEPKLEIPFSWVVNNLMNPDHFLHMCLYLKSL